MAIRDYEEVSVYPIDDEKRERLLALQTECAVVWTTRDGWPVGVLHRFVWRDGSFWVTCSGHRKRVPALRRNGKSCIIVSSEGTPLGRDQTITAKTSARVFEDRATKDWFYPALAAKMNPDDPARAAWFRDMLDSPRRVIIQLEPVKWITYDGVKLAEAVRASQAAAG
jgi:general stress protein 26